MVGDDDVSMYTLFIFRGMAPATGVLAEDWGEVLVAKPGLVSEVGE